MRPSIPLKFPALLGVAFVSVLAFASARVYAEATSVRCPMPPAFVSTCVPPGTFVSGHLHIMTRMTFNGISMHVGMETNSAGARIYVFDPELQDYVEFVSNESHMEEVNVNAGATEFTSHQSFRYTSPGRRDNYKLSMMVHCTFNARGELTAEVVRTTIDCYYDDVECCGG